MSGNRLGGKKVVETRVQKYMSQGYTETEARAKVSEDYRRIGAKGGKNGNTGGFASEKIGSDGITGRERARVAGAIGGARSKRRKKDA